MVTCIILAILWLLYTVALGKFMFYICDQPPAPLFDVNSTGMCAGFVLAMTGWIFFSFYVGSYIFGC